MNRQQARGHLLQLVGAILEGWGRVINDQTMQIRGEGERLSGRLQAREGAPRAVLVSRRPDRKPIA